MANQHVLARAFRAIRNSVRTRGGARRRAMAGKRHGVHHDLGATCVNMTVSGRTITCNDGTQVALDASITPSCPRFAIARSASGYTLVCGVPNATGLWWRADEDGRGTWLSHQGDTIFAVDYAYDSTNLPRWRTLTAVKRDDGVFTGDVYETHGPSFSAATFDTHAVAANYVGSGWIAQDDAEHVRVNMAEGVGRALTRQRFARSPRARSDRSRNMRPPTNYTDLWWNPAEWDGASISRIRATRSSPRGTPTARTARALFLVTTSSRPQRGRTMGISIERRAPPVPR